MSYGFYKPLSNPAGLTGTVGGNISSYQFSGQLAELFAHVSAPPSGLDPVYQYRKIFIKNEFSSSSANTRVWLDAVDRPEQIAIALGTALADSTTSPTGQPASVTGWVSPYNYVNGISLGTLAVNGYTGIWVRQTLTGIVESDPYCTLRIYAGGAIG